jgi:hypothetical protein
MLDFGHNFCYYYSCQEGKDAHPDDIGGTPSEISMEVKSPARVVDRVQKVGRKVADFLPNLLTPSRIPAIITM